MDNLIYRINFSDSNHINQELENLDNGTKILHFVISGRAATKKTNQRVIRRGKMTRILPSIQFENYEKKDK